jgi:hypothetical protein
MATELENGRSQNCGQFPREVRDFLFSKERGMPGKYLAILNISRTGHAALM